MTDYLPLIVRAVEGLEKNTGEARRSLYERARNALVTAASIRGTRAVGDRDHQAAARAGRRHPQVEAEAARRSRAELRDQRNAALPPRPERFTPPPPPPDQGRGEPRRNEPPRPPGGEGDTQNRRVRGARTAPERAPAVAVPGGHEGLARRRERSPRARGAHRPGPRSPPATPAIHMAQCRRRRRPKPSRSFRARLRTSFGHEEPPPDHTAYSPVPDTRRGSKRTRPRSTRATRRRCMPRTMNTTSRARRARIAASSRFWWRCWFSLQWPEW